MGSTGSAVNPATLSPGNASYVYNSQLIPSVRSGNYYPRAPGTAGPGGISSGITNPAFPPQTGGPGFPGASTGGSGSQAGAQAGAAPFSLVQSPLVWSVAALIVAVVLLRFVHHGY